MSLLWRFIGGLVAFVYTICIWYRTCGLFSHCRSTVRRSCTIDSIIAREGAVAAAALSNAGVAEPLVKALQRTRGYAHRPLGNRTIERQASDIEHRKRGSTDGWGSLSHRASRRRHVALLDVFRLGIRATSAQAAWCRSPDESRDVVVLQVGAWFAVQVHGCCFVAKSQGIAVLQSSTGQCRDVVVPMVSSTTQACCGAAGVAGGHARLLL